MMAIRKIALMYSHFGKCDGHIFGECSNLISIGYHGRSYRKCKAYGETNSEASDWVKKWAACGLFNQIWNGRPIIELVRPTRDDKQQIEPLEGQISMIKEGVRWRKG